jgi:hypothetical protein
MVMSDYGLMRELGSSYHREPCELVLIGFSGHACFAISVMTPLVLDIICPETTRVLHCEWRKSALVIVFMHDSF